MSSMEVLQINEGWHFKQVGDDAAVFLPTAQFPTNVHLDLIHNRLIPDPFIAKNEDLVQWIGEKAWVYKTNFMLPQIQSGRTAVMVFDGLDTFATVVLNGHHMLETDNMFIPERVDVTRILKLGAENTLEITFDSAFLIGKKIVEKYPDHHWGCWNGDPSRLAVRKAQYHYGWDWGPALLTCGPWRPIYLEIFVSRISDLWFVTTVQKSLVSAEIEAKASVEGIGEEIVFDLLYEGKSVASETAKVHNALATATFRIKNPQLWYPASYGKQPMYLLRATLITGKQAYHLATKRIGLRRVNVVQRTLRDAPGTTFFFEINNIPVFCGGSDWIPADSFIPRISPQKYRDWVKLVVDGHQVMLRVWGGGIFEEKSFYDACDEMGVLVWQDFMFGCGNYPAHKEFLASVKREATANVKILRHHPSIVIWAGNNEDYQYAESELDYDRNDDDPQSWLKSAFPARYIYQRILPKVIKEHSPNTYYHFGSPFGGKDTRDPTVGDIHQWNVWHGRQEKYQNFDQLIGRFVSEFGMEAFPSQKTIDGYLQLGKKDPDRYPQSSTVDFHNKADGHERRIALYLVENIQYKFEPFEQFIYCTQLIQAECLASAFRLWRRQWKGPGQEYCAGALVWQINDCWPVTSWAVIDYHLRPKLAYYTIKRELAPITISLKRTVHTIPADVYTRAYIRTVHKIEIWASNLSLRSCTVSVHLKAWDVVTGKEKVSQILQSALVLPPNRSVEIGELEVPVSKKNTNEELDTVIAAYLVENGVQIARHVNWPEPLKYAHLQSPKRLAIRLSEDAKQVNISAEVPVKGVALESRDDAVVWKDNCVDIVPGETVQVGVKGLQSLVGGTVDCFEEEDELWMSMSMSSIGSKAVRSNENENKDESYDATFPSSVASRDVVVEHEKVENKAPGKIFDSSSTNDIRII